MNAPKKMHSDDEEHPHRQLGVGGAGARRRRGACASCASASGRRRRASAGARERRLGHRSVLRRSGLDRPGVDAEQQHDHARDREPRALEHRGVPEDRQPQRHDQRVERRRRQVDAVRLAVSARRRASPCHGAVVRSRRQEAGRAGPLRPRCTCGARSRRAACTCGTSAKLYSGTGDGIDHSSVRPSHGSALATSPSRSVLITFTRNTSTDSAMTNAPIVASRFMVSQPMSAAYR